MVTPRTPGPRAAGTARAAMGARRGVLRPSVLAAITGAITVAMLAMAAVLAAVGPGDAQITTLTAVAFGGVAAVGAVVAARRPDNAVGWLLSVAAFSMAALQLAGALADRLAAGGSDGGRAVDLLRWLGEWGWVPAFVALFALFPLLFPTGAPPAPRWRAVAWIALGAAVVDVVANAFAPGPLGSEPGVENPLGIAGFPSDLIRPVADWALLAATAAAIASLVVRYRRSRGVERRQLQWVLLAGVVLLVCLLAGATGQDVFWPALMVGVLALSAAVAVAMLRYRLYDIEVVVNRALVYGALTATLAATYLGAVLLLRLVAVPLTGDSGLAVAASTLAVAALFRPARTRIQSAVDRRFYRRKYDAQRTVQGFAARLRDEVDLATVTAELRAAVGDTMGPAHVSLWLVEPRR